MSDTPVRAGIEQVAKRLWAATEEETGASSGVRICGLSADDVESAARVVADAYRRERFTTAALGSDVRARVEPLVTTALRACRAHSQPLFVARDEAVVGVAVLTRPGFDVSERLPTRTRLQALAGLRAARLRGIRRVLRLREPPAELSGSYSLEALAVDPDRQGEGVGKRLLDAVHRLVDSDPGVDGVHLATASERLCEMYAAHGYRRVETRVEERLSVDGDPLRAYHMHRERE